MNKREYLQPTFDCVIVFLLGVTYPVLTEGTVACSDDEDIVVAIVNDLLNELPLLFVGCRKQLHASRNAVHFHQCLDDVLPLLLKVGVS